MHLIQTLEVISETVQWNDIAKLIMEYYVDKSTMNDQLIKSSCRGDLRGIKLLYSYGANVRTLYCNAIMRASENGHLDVVQFLYSNCGYSNYAIRYSLIYAAEQGHLNIIKYLPAANAPVKYMMDGAIREGKLNVLQYLYQKSAYRASEHNILSAIVAGHFEVVQFLSQHGSTFDTIHLKLACLNGHTRLVKYLYLKGLQFEDFEDCIFRVVVYNNYHGVARFMYMHGFRLTFVESDSTGMLTLYNKWYTFSNSIRHYSRDMLKYMN